MVSTKWLASRWAASTLVSPASGFHHQRCPAAVMRCGSNTHTAEPGAARSPAVAAHRSALLLVAMTAPGADSTYGMPSEVVLPLRGPMNASTVSSQEAYRSGPFPPGCLRRPSTSPMSAGGRLPGRAPVSDGRSRMPCSAA